MAASSKFLRKWLKSSKAMTMAQQLTGAAETSLKMKSKRTTTKGLVLAATALRALVSDLRELIHSARETVAHAVDSALTALYWQLGKRVRRDIRREKRADYGAEIVSAQGRQLAAEFGRGFDEKSLRRMIRFAETFPDEKIVSALRRQLSWTQFKRLIYLDDPLKRDFYAEMCRIDRWSTRALEEKIGGMLFERTALSRKPEKLAVQELKALREEDKMTPDLVFRDPYLLGFLGLKDSYVEKNLEPAILRDMESFILELGVGFHRANLQPDFRRRGRGGKKELPILSCLFPVVASSTISRMSWRPDSPLTTISMPATLC
ncbi:MAG: DUF1016 family protein [Verrucomicrobiales bacterium]|nr:DUF1016 family protein [Verrucomicrobiales bacterium]